MWLSYGLRDIQCDPVVAYCHKCFGEIYTEEAMMPGHLCLECWEEEHGRENKSIS